MLRFLKKVLFNTVYIMSRNENPTVPIKKARNQLIVPCPDETKDESETAQEEANSEWLRRLQQIVSCPVCYELIRPPVVVCINGHSVCKKCKCRLSHCPMCSSDFTKARNTMLAQIADYLKYPCPNSYGGCNEVLYLRDLNAHLRNCQFFVHHCKIDECSWIGKKDELKGHVEKYHKEDLWKKDWSFAGSRKFEMDDTTSDEFGKLLVIENELFWMVSNYDCDKKKLYKCFQYIGSPEEAKQFSYQISLRTVDERKQIFFRSPVDNDLSIGSEIYDSPNCTSIDFNILKTFSNNSSEKKLKFLYTIHKS